jgi:alkylhydroperoxidase family enzyme
MNLRRVLLVLLFIVVAQVPDEAQRVSKARIPPLEPSEWTDTHRHIVGSSGERTADVLKTCLRSVELCRAWTPFLRYILSTTSTLPPRERELVILRTGYLCRADYEWGHHVDIGKRAGLTDEEILRITKGPGAPGWSEFDRALLRAADELHKDQFITDATWNALSKRYNERQLMDLIFTAGQYTMVSMFLNSAGVQLEEGYSGLPK